MERNRSIHMSFRFLGMEVASLMVTEDSIYAAYKLERIYFAESIRDLMGGFPATVGNVQDMILGRPFVLGENNVALSQCTLAGNGATWTITPDRSPMGMKYDFTIDTPTGNVELLTVNLPARSPITADYSDFDTSCTGPMAGNTSISAKTSKTTFTGEITLNPRKADWGKGYGKSWTVPKGYARVHAEDIIKKLNAKKITSTPTNSHPNSSPLLLMPQFSRFWIRCLTIIMMGLMLASSPADAQTHKSAHAHNVRHSAAVPNTAQWKL